LTQNQSINFSSFFTDTTFMSDSAFYSESSNVDEDDSGAGNTEAFNNFAVNYQINMPRLNNTLFNVGYAFQKQGRASQDDENATTLGLKKNFNFNENLNMDVLAEYAQELNSGGTVDRRIRYGNIGTRLNYDKAFFSTTVTKKDSNSDHHRKKYYSFAVGYEVMKDVEASIGWNAADAKSERTESVMFTLGYKFDICPCE
jgi:hypothetical protein